MGAFKEWAGLPAEARNATPAGELPWEIWGRKARHAGLPDLLAVVGVMMIRDAYLHSWAPALQVRAGWDDDGAAMLEFGRKRPERAMAEWDEFVEADGGQRRPLAASIRAELKIV